MRQNPFFRGAIACKLAIIAMLIGFGFTIVNEAKAQVTTTATSLYANLSGPPISGMIPRGLGRYTVLSDGTRIFETNVNSVNLAAATNLTVSVNGTSAGQITLTAFKNGILRLSTDAGQTVPMVASGATLSVRNGATEILSGAFAAPPPPTPAIRLFAPLTGSAIGGIMPRGLGIYESDAMGRDIEVSVEQVNLAANTSLSVEVNGNAIGMIAVNATMRGFLRVMGTAVPNIVSGSTLTIKNGTSTILAGTFGTAPPPPPPSPMPTAAFFARLDGPVIDGVMPKGAGQYLEFGTVKKLGVFVRQVRLASGTVLNVMIGTANAGTITLNSIGEGNLRLDSSTGATVPTVTDGTAITIKNGTTTILSGTFRPPIMPPPPTPMPVRFFGGRMSGSQVVPPVTTTARGEITVVLNQAETQIQVFCGFFGLSSAQTTAKIFGPAPTGETAAEIFNLGTIGGTSGRIPVRNFNVTAEQVTQLRTGLWYAQIGTTNNANGEIRGQIRSHARGSAFQGAATDDIALFRPDAGQWYIKTGTGLETRTIGSATDKPISGDFDGDGRTDAAVYSGGNWIIKRSSDSGVTTKQFGLPTDIPVRADFDGDGRNDFAVFRESIGYWFYERSSDRAFVAVQFGQAGDQPLPADMDGDGKSDIVIFRKDLGDWYYMNSSNGAVTGYHFGAIGDKPVIGDFDGDGRNDLTVFRESDGGWYSILSRDGRFTSIQFGAQGDIAVAGNYDGDGITDIAVYRAGIWYIRRSIDGMLQVEFFGRSGDIPAIAN